MKRTKEKERDLMRFYRSSSQVTAPVAKTCFTGTCSFLQTRQVLTGVVKYLQSENEKSPFYFASVSLTIASLFVIGLNTQVCVMFAHSPTSLVVIGNTKESWVVVSL